LATVRIGAIHSVVFAGFGAKALADRIQASGSRLVFTADVTYRKGKNVQLKEIVDDALESLGAAPSETRRTVEAPTLSAPDTGRTAHEIETGRIATGAEAER